MKPVIIFSVFILVITLFFYTSCKKEYSCEGNCIENKPPVAIAGPDQKIILPKDSVFLDGSNSSDVDGKIVSYKWRKIAGPVSSLIVKDDSSKTNAKTLVMGVYHFELMVSDNGGLSAKDTVQIIVDDPAKNQPPVANAGKDMIITLPTDSVLLNGNASFDPDGTIVNYIWTKVSGPSVFYIINWQSVQSHVKNLMHGVYTFELTVTDNGGLSAKDTIQITVNDIVTSNIPPVAIAGNDTTIISNQTSCTPLPITITLNGTSSYDPDGTVVNYLWSGSYGIITPGSAITTVGGLVPGATTIILMVTDNKGAQHEDTFKITIVPANRALVPAQLIPIGTLSLTSVSAMAAAGNKILFISGGVSSQQGCASPQVDIYDIVTGSFTTAQLSQARVEPAVAVLGNKIFFAGGIIPKKGPPGDCYITNGYSTRSDVIDIYDVSTNTWSTSQLSNPGVPASASAGNKVVFAGGDDAIVTRNVDIYNATTNTWTTALLSEGKHILQPAVSGNKIYFPGGTRDIYGVSGGYVTNKIDVYDVSSDMWTVETLQLERGEMGAVIVNNKLYCGGGFIPQTNSTDYIATRSVEIKDLVTNTSTFDCLFHDKGGIVSYKRNNTILFFSKNMMTGADDKFDIYDVTTSTWSIGVLPRNLWGPFISHNNIIYCVEGNKLYRLDF